MPPGRQAGGHVDGVVDRSCLVLGDDLHYPQAAHDTRSGTRSGTRLVPGREETPTASAARNQKGR